MIDRKTLIVLIDTAGLTGDVDDIEIRMDKYGVNVIPQKPPPSFLQLAWEAFQDPLLIILSAAAFVTIGLSFYKPPPDDAEGQYVAAMVVTLFAKIFIQLLYSQ